MNIRPYRNSMLDAYGMNDFYNMIDSFFNDQWSGEKALKRASFKVDIAEDDKAYTVEAELPGIDKEDININLDDGQLTIQVVQNEDKEVKEKNYIHKERKSSEMSRTMYFNDIDPEALKANLDNGVLTISIPKKEELKTSRKIEIE